MLYCTVHALGELAVIFPVAGSFAAYSTRFIDPAWGFAMGWNYAMSWLVTMPLEVVAASITVDYWGSGVNNAAWITVFLVLIISINFFGVKGYGEAEFVFSIIKVIAVIGFMWVIPFPMPVHLLTQGPSILGIVLDCGGASPSGGYVGGKFWRDPGAFNNGFKGLCSVFVTAAFAFGGTELVGLAAAETANPRKSLPTAVKQVFWRITLFYVIALTLVGLLVPYTDPRLLNESGVSSNAHASPFVIAIQTAGVAGLPSVMNVVIMISVLSVGNSAVYGSSRTMAALAEQRQAPAFLAYIDRRGRPVFAIIVASFVGLIAYVGASDKQVTAFNWLIALSGLSSLFTWSSICLAHIRFRKAWRVQGHDLDELAFRSQPGVLGSWAGLSFNALVLVAQFWTGFAPIGYGGQSASERVNGFFQAYLAAPIVASFYISYKIWFKTEIIRSRDMDLHSGRRDLDLAYLIAEEKAERARWPVWKKVYKFLC